MITRRDAMYESASAVAEREVEPAVLPDVPDRRNVPPAVAAVRAEAADMLLREEGFPLLVRQCVLAGRGRQVQEPPAHDSSRIPTARTGEPYATSSRSGKP